VLLAATVCVAGQLQKPDQLSPADCGKRNVIVYEGDMGHLLATLAEQNKTVIGFETIPHQTHRTIKLTACFATLNDLLVLIVAAAPEYEWQSKEGFIDVYPKTSRLLL